MEKPPTINLEKDAVARTLGKVLSSEYDWQHIRDASQAFVDVLEVLSNGNGIVASELKRFTIDRGILTSQGLSSMLTEIALYGVKAGYQAGLAENQSKGEES